MTPSWPCPWCEVDIPLEEYIALRRPHWLADAGWAYRCPKPECQQIIALAKPIEEINKRYE